MKKSIAGNAFIVTAFSTAGLLLSFFVNIVIAARFGARQDMDVYLVGISIPFFINSVLQGAMIASIVPVFAEYGDKEPDQVWRIASSLISNCVLFMFALCLMGFIFAHPIIRLIVPGFSPEMVARSVDIFRICLPSIPLMTICLILSGVYFSHQRFIAPSLNAVIDPLITFVYMELFSARMSTRSLAFALTTAVTIRTIILAAGFLIDRQFHYKPVLDLKHPGVRKAFVLTLTMVLGILFTQMLPIFDRYFMSAMPEGTISRLGYAFKIYNVFVLVIATGISMAVFPVMAAYANETSKAALLGIMSKSARMLLYVSIPASAFISAFGLPLVMLIYERGGFTHSDTVATFKALSFYMLALPPAVAGTIFASGFYVLKKNAYIAAFSLIIFVIYVLSCLMLIKPFGYCAIPLAYTVYYHCGILLAGAVFRYHLVKAGGRNFVIETAKMYCAALVSLVAVYPLIRWFTPDRPISVILICIASVLYFFVGRFIFRERTSRIFLKEISERYIARFLSRER